MTQHLWNRRSFLRFSLLAGISLSSAPLVWAGPDARCLAVAPLALTNLHTGEKLSVTFRDRLGAYDPEALAAINQLLRCHYTDEVHEIDVCTLEFLQQVNISLGGGRDIHVISGYRSPTYNELLRRQGHKVASNSLHLKGQAVDIRIPGIGLKTVRQIAVGLQGGGVGYYPRSGFVHLDSGEFRTW